MIVNIFEIIFVFFLCKQINRKKINKIVLLSFLFQVVLLLIYRIELNELGRSVYYSDAEGYWNDTILLLNGGNLIGSQVGYAYFCSIIQRMSPFVDVIWNNISNILLVDISVLLIAKLMIKYNVVMNNIIFFVKISLFNPLLIYSLMRNLKDALFVFCLVCIIFIYCHFKETNKYIDLILLLFFSLFISSVRPWGFLIFPILLLVNFIITKQYKYFMSYILLFLLGIVIILFIYAANLYRHIQVWVPIVVSNMLNSSISDLLIAPFRMFLGPGVYRALFGNEYFMFYTNTGNVCCAIGCLMWYYNISLFLVKVVNFNFTTLTSLLSGILLFFVLLYSMQYHGSLDVRFRGILYILTYAVFLSGYKYNFKNKMTATSYMLFCFILITATIAGI